MKFLVASLFIFCFLGCNTENKTMSFIDIIDEGINNDKMSLVYLYNPTTTKHKKIEVVLSNKYVKDVIDEFFLFHKIDVRHNTFFNELMYSCAENFFLLLENDSIVSIIFLDGNNPTSFVEKLNNYTDYKFASLVNKVSFLQGKKDEIAIVINSLLSLQYRFDKNLITRTQFEEGVSRTIEKLPYFYNRYLSMSISNFQFLEGSGILNSLSTFERKLYEKYVHHMLAHKNAIDTSVKSNISFEYLNHDFGQIEYNQRVRCAFLYINNGKVPSLIYDIEPSCGCIVAGWTKKPLLSDAIDSIQIEFTGNALGVFEKDIKVKSNSRQKEIRLKIRGEVVL